MIFSLYLLWIIKTHTEIYCILISDNWPFSDSTGVKLTQKVFDSCKQFLIKLLVLLFLTNLKIKVPLTPKYFFGWNLSLHLFETHCDIFVPFFTKSWLLIDFKTEHPLVHDQVRRGVGLFLIWRHKLICIALTLCKHACKVDCGVKSGIDPLPFWLDREAKDAWFFVSFEANKKAGFNKKREEGFNSFRTGAQIYFSKKNILGYWAL